MSAPVRIEAREPIWEVFPIGCRVELSEAGRRLYPLRAAVGTVVGYSRDRKLVRVLRDGRIEPLSANPNHWQPVVDATGAAIEEHW